MKYTREERLVIGKRIYDGELNRYQAALEYGISEASARDYMRQYRFTNGLPAKSSGGKIKRESVQPKPVILDPDLEEYESMTKTVSGIPSEIPIARLPLAKRQDSVG